jgi:signal transduction histidine kinase
MSIKSRQVAGVTTLVVLTVAVLSVFHLATLARLSVQETASRGDLLGQAIFQRARELVPAAAGQDSYAALRQDGGIRALLESAVAYSPNVTYAAIVGRDGTAFAHSFRQMEGQHMPEQVDVSALVNAGQIELLRDVYSDRTYEIRQPMLFEQQEFGSIRIGISTLLIKDELKQALRQSLQNVLVAILVATLVAMLLAQWMLRPIHVIQSGLTRLGRGELDVRLDLPDGEEFKDIGTSFNAVSQELSASRAKALSPSTDFESVVENLEDAVALFSPDGTLMFCNPAMGTILPGFSAADSRHLDAMAPDGDPVRQLVERTLAAHTGQGPATISRGVRLQPDQPEEPTELLVISHPVDDEAGRFVGAMLVARNLGYLNQVHSTLKYSQKLAAFGRLMAGVAHEVKNPLNAMTIHLELLRNKVAKLQAAPEPVAAGVAAASAAAAAIAARPADIGKHVEIIAKEIQRLDTVVNGFLKFARPDELKLQPVALQGVISDVATTVGPEAEQRHVAVKHECPRDLPDVNADPAMLRQALLNLALNACQAMPDGGTLRLACRAAPRRRIEIDVEDTGVGIAPENLQKIFDLYFTTRDKGSGIGLSMVYRIVQLHDGDIEVESTPGVGTRFRLFFPQA